MNKFKWIKVTVFFWYFCPRRQPLGLKWQSKEMIVWTLLVAHAFSREQIRLNSAIGFGLLTLNYSLLQPEALSSTQRTETPTAGDWGMSSNAWDASKWRSKRTNRKGTKCIHFLHGILRSHWYFFSINFLSCLKKNREIIGDLFYHIPNCAALKNIIFYV